MIPRLPATDGRLLAMAVHFLRTREKELYHEHQDLLRKVERMRPTDIARWNQLVQRIGKKET